MIVPNTLLMIRSRSLTRPILPKVSNDKHFILGSPIADFVAKCCLMGSKSITKNNKNRKLCLFSVPDNNGRISKQSLANLRKTRNIFSKSGILVESKELKGTLAASIACIKAAAIDPSVHGIIVTLPIPDKFKEILHYIPKRKDIDGINPLYNRIPSTADGAAALVKLHYTPEDKVLVLGSSGFVGSGVVRALNAMNIPFTSFDKKRTMQSSCTSQLEHHLSQATIVVTAMGSGGAITAGVLQQYPKKLIVDSGFSVSSTGVVMGDVHPDVYTTPHTVSHITPVPCGCGPLEMAVLLHRFAVSAGLETVQHMTFEDILRQALQQTGGTTTTTTTTTTKLQDYNNNSQ